MNATDLHINRKPGTAIILWRWAIFGVVLLMGVPGCGFVESDEAGGEDHDLVLAETQEAYWVNLQSLCGHAYAGTQVRGALEPFWSESDLTMHVWECSADTVKIAFQAAGVRDRSFLFSRTETGLRFKQDRRQRDGTPQRLTGHGGHTWGAGSPNRQEFPIDEYSLSLVPGATGSVWTFEIMPAETWTYQYELRQEGRYRILRVEFDLSETVPPPPPPWGHL